MLPPQSLRCGCEICRVGCEQIVVLFLVLRCIREIFFFLFDSFCQILQLDLDIFLLFQVFFFLFQVLIGVLDLAGTRGELLTQFLRSPLRLLDRQGRSGHADSMIFFSVIFRSASSF